MIGKLSEQTLTLNRKRWLQVILFLFDVGLNFIKLLHCGSNFKICNLTEDCVMFWVRTEAG